MKRLQILLRILKVTGMLKIVEGFVAFLLVAALGIMLFEPQINSYGDALWYLFASFTTIGYGDIVASTLGGKIITVIVSLYGILVVAFIPAVIINYYTEVTKNQCSDEDTDRDIFSTLEHLPSLSKKELEELSEKIRKRNKNINN